MSATHSPQRRGLLGALVGIGLIVAGIGIAIALIGGSAASAVDPRWLDEQPSGEVRYCTGEDVSGSQSRSVRDFNRRFHGQLRAELVQTSTTTNVAHDDYLPILQAKHQDQCDVIYLDVIYMPEFADKHLLYDMTPYLRRNDRAAHFNASMMRTVTYDKGKLWGVPKQLDAGVLFYRTDKGLRRPLSWRDLFREAQPQAPGERPRLRFQAADYEGLVVVFLELAYSAGAQPIISDDGKEARLDQEPAIQAVTAMRHAIGRSVPNGSINQTDKGSLSVFERGRALFMRSWPFAYGRIYSDADHSTAKDAGELRRTANNFHVMPLPPWRRGGHSVAVLGGHDLVLARNSQNPQGALKLIDFLTSIDETRQDAKDYGLYPVLKTVEHDPDVNGPTIAAIKQSRIVPRPVIVNYDAVSQVIADGVKKALRSDEPVREAMRELDAKVQRLLG